MSNFRPSEPPFYASISKETAEARQGVIEAARNYFEKTQVKKPFAPGVDYIPVTAKVLDSNDLSYLIHSCLDLWLTAGPYAKQFEQELPKRFNRTVDALLVNSGSSANLLAVSALGSTLCDQLVDKSLQRGDEVITLAAGFPTTINPIVQNGFIPRFVDIDLETLNALPEKVMEAKTEKTKAVILAHTLGNPFRSDIIAEWCKKVKLYFIEDCCDALGAQIGGQPVGSFGDYATLSFYPAHHITMGEGGAVLARNGKFRRVAESLRDWGRDCWCDPGKDNTCGKRFGWNCGALPNGYDHKYVYSSVGYNLKATDMQAAIGLSQLQKLDGFIETRRMHWGLLNDGIQSSPLLKEHLLPVKPTEGTNPSWFGFAILCSPSIKRDLLVQFLESKKIGTRLLFGGNMTKQPAFKSVEFRIHDSLNATDEVMRRTFWIGVHPALDRARIQYMLEQLETGIKSQVA